MNSKFRVKQVTKLYESCNKCGLPIINCICGKIEKIHTTAQIWILCSEREFYRPSNTARLLKLVNPESTEIILWERTKPCEKLIKVIDSENYETFLLFPEENNELEESVSEKTFKNTKTHKARVFIILDGTWKEAEKMFRKSDYLKKLTRISLKPEHKSKYTLRRGAGEGELCTIEAAIEVLKLNNEHNNAEIINNVFELFIRSFKAGASGVKLVE